MVNDHSGLGTTGEWLFAVRDENGDALFAVPLKYDRKAAFNRKVSKERFDVPITQALLGNEIIMDMAPDYLEKPVLASTRYIPSVDWGLVAKINESEISSIVSNTYHLHLKLGVLILLSALFIGAIIGWIFCTLFRGREALPPSELEAESNTNLTLVKEQANS